MDLSMTRESQLDWLLVKTMSNVETFLMTEDAEELKKDMDRILDEYKKIFDIN